MASASNGATVSVCSSYILVCDTTGGEVTRYPTLEEALGELDDLGINAHTHIKREVVVTLNSWVKVILITDPLLLPAAQPPSPTVASLGHLERLSSLQKFLASLSQHDVYHINPEMRRAVRNEVLKKMYGG